MRGTPRIASNVNHTCLGPLVVSDMLLNPVASILLFQLVPVSSNCFPYRGIYMRAVDRLKKRSSDKREPEGNTPAHYCR